MLPYLNQLYVQDDDDEDEEEEGGLSKSGKELKKLLGKAAGLNESDAEEDNEEDVNYEEDVILFYLLKLACLL